MSTLTTMPFASMSQTLARNSALPPSAVPVSTMTSGRVSTSSSWYTQRSSGHFLAAWPNHDVFFHVRSRAP